MACTRSLQGLRAMTDPNYLLNDKGSSLHCHFYKTFTFGESQEKNGLRNQKFSMRINGV